MKRKLLFSLLILLSAGLVISACSKDDDNTDGDNPDENLTPLEKAKKAYETEYLGTKVNTIGWTGNEASCNSGDIAAATRDKVVKRVNYYRALVGLPAVKLNPAQNKSCQDAALIMMANNTLNHTPPSSFTCWTQDGYNAASTGNLAIGWGSQEPDANHSINAVSGYIEDPGGGNEIVGHRAWLLHPALSAIGTGSVYDANHSYSGMHGAAANCIRWGDNLNGSSTGPEFIAYPPANYVPSVLVFPRWSFAVANADFSSASVTVKDANGKTYPCNIIAHVPQQGSINPAARVVWEPQGINITSDMNFEVTVSNVKGASKTSYTYTVKAFYVTGQARKATEKSKMLIL
jgi:uncharacterized protein YkwD